MRSATPADTPALLILDMLNLFDFDGGSALGRASLRCSRVIRRLRGRFDAAGGPVIYVNDNFSRWQGGLRELLARCSLAAEPSPTIAAAIAPGPGHYHVLKPKHSAFLDTPLELLLAKLGIRRLVLTGVAADSCILATALDANMRELGLWIPRDAVAAITPARRDRALALVKASFGADVRGSRSVPGLFPDAGPAP